MPRLDREHLWRTNYDSAKRRQKVLHEWWSNSGIDRLPSLYETLHNVSFDSGLKMAKEEILKHKNCTKYHDVANSPGIATCLDVVVQNIDLMIDSKKKRRTR